MEELSFKSELLKEKGIFLGGNIKRFEEAGRRTLITLLNEGLPPYSKILDIGCGCLRIGYWLIHFLQEGCYFGIEPNKEILMWGKNIF